MPSNRTYYIEYINWYGQKKIYRNKMTGSIKEYSRYDNALKLKNWFLDKGFEDVRIKEIKY